jgi:release factor glutamine methyltransferase
VSAGATAQSALIAGIKTLKEAGVEGAPRDARRLMSFALDIVPDRLTLHLHDPIPADASARFDAAIAARAARHPVSHITGVRAFWGREFRVTKDTLDPRPETEILIDAALQDPFETVLDLGLGTGCILLTLLAERPSARGVGGDISAAALRVASENAARFGLVERADLRLSDWFEDITGQFDLITSNPPYIAQDEMAALSPEVRLHEPHLALTPGGDGLGPYRIIAAQAALYLRPQGRVLVEIGPTQGQAVSEFFRTAGFADVSVLHDFDGRDRVVRASMG